MAKAVWKDIVLAESDDIVLVEGNVYFPRKDVDWGYIQLSDELPETYCHWKGMAEYYDIFNGNEPNKGAAWAYLQPYEEAEAIAGRVAFWNGIDVSGGPDGMGQLEETPSRHIDKAGWKGLCWYLKFTEKNHIDPADIEANTGIPESELGDAWQDYNVQRYAKQYGWKLSLSLERT
tara:strand:- start:380 stop:907 length:528 start_codon:yes stop_codon:yes gene_type:complete